MNAKETGAACAVRAGVGILSFDVYDGLPVQRLPLQRVGTRAEAATGGAPGAGGGLDGFEDLEAVLSPETAAASRAAEAEAAEAEAAKGAAPNAPKSGVTLLGGLVTAQSKVSEPRLRITSRARCRVPPRVRLCLTSS